MGIPEVEGKERREEENSGEWADFQQELTSIHRNNISGTGRKGSIPKIIVLGAICVGEEYVYRGGTSL